jgi:hypothetical protein
MTQREPDEGADEPRSKSAPSAHYRHRHRHRADEHALRGQGRREGISRSHKGPAGCESGAINSHHTTAGRSSVAERTVGVSLQTGTLIAPAHRQDASPRTPRSPAQRRLRFVALSILFVLALCAGSVIGETREARAGESARQAHSVARDFLQARAQAASTAIVAAATHVESARTVLGSNEATLLTDDERSTFESTLSAADAVLRDARLQVAEATRQASTDVSPEATADQIGRATATLAHWELVTASEIDALHRSLTDAVATVTVAFEGWQAEQNRIAAERAAQELAAQLAAQQAAAQAQAVAGAEAEAEAAARAHADAEAAAAQHGAQEQESAASAGGAAPASPPAASTTPPAPSAQTPAGHTEHVWATGFQHELDACKGSVDMAPSFGVAVIGEHWSCGGSEFPTAEGTLVTLTGVLSGTYRVGPVVAVLSQRTNTTSDVPGGYDLLYQTCQGGDNSRMSFTALQRIE